MQDRTKVKMNLWLAKSRVDAQLVEMARVIAESYPLGSLCMVRSMARVVKDYRLEGCSLEDMEVIVSPPGFDNDEEAVHYSNLRPISPEVARQFEKKPGDSGEVVREVMDDLLKQVSSPNKKPKQGSATPANKQPRPKAVSVPTVLVQRDLWAEKLAQAVAKQVKQQVPTTVHQGASSEITYNINVQLPGEGADAPEPTGWQDISTAPKGGERILGHNRDTGDTQTISWRTFRNKDGQYWEAWGTDAGAGTHTHWQPLPPPPAPEG